jgi:hypothetical protein
VTAFPVTPRARGGARNKTAEFVIETFSIVERGPV